MEHLPGHDGLGNFYGKALISTQTEEVIPFGEILKDTDKIPPDSIEGATDYGIGLLTSPDKEDTWDKLGIDPNGIEGKPGKDGTNGIDGKQGPEGPMGPVGPAGLNWQGEYTDFTTYEKDDAVGYQGASYFCLKESSGFAPLPENEHWALLASQGARGPAGPAGTNGRDGLNGTDGKPGTNGKDGTNGTNGKDGVFDPATLTDADIATLHDKLKELDPVSKWAYRCQVVNGTPKTFTIGDTNLDLTVTYTGTDNVRYGLTSHNSSLPADYFIRRYTIYNTISQEGKSTTNYRPQTFNSTPWLLDDFAYSDGKEDWRMNLIDPTNKTFYRVFGQMCYDQTGNYLYVHVEKVGAGGYIDV